MANLDHFFRHESAKIKAVIVKLFGLAQIEIAEDIVQDTIVEALESWKENLPYNPEGWLMDVAKKKTIDYLRRRNLYEKKIYPHLCEQTIEVDFGLEDISDSLLRMIFCCCHPLLQKESQISLALKVLCGFSISQIASSLLTSETTIHKRLYRAKQKFRSGEIPFEIPTDLLEQRMETVHLTLYVLFNEGYYSSHPDKLICIELCSEAIRLTRLLLDIFPKTLHTHSLLALMLFQVSRMPSRLDQQGGIVILEEQNRNLWHRELIAEGMFHLQKATQDNKLYPFILKAGIAAEHCVATNFSSTNWHSICRQYQLLLQMEDTPIIQLNFAISQYFNQQQQEALQRLHNIEKALPTYSLLPATLGELYFREKKIALAQKYFQQALKISKLALQKKLLYEKLEMCKKI